MGVRHHLTFYNMFIYRSNCWIPEQILETLDQSLTRHSRPDADVFCRCNQPCSSLSPSTLICHSRTKKKRSQIPRRPRRFFAIPWKSVPARSTESFNMMVDVLLTNDDLEPCITPEPPSPYTSLEENAAAGESSSSNKPIFFWI